MVKCDICYAPNMPEAERIELIRLMCRRREAMHDKYMADAPTTHLSTYHIECIKAGIPVYTAHTPVDKSQLSSGVADRTRS
jgi:hypothetical protein